MHRLVIPVLLVAALGACGGSGDAEPRPFGGTVDLGGVKITVYKGRDYPSSPYSDPMAFDIDVTNESGEPFMPNEYVVTVESAGRDAPEDSSADVDSLGGPPIEDGMTVEFGSVHHGVTDPEDVTLRITPLDSRVPVAEFTTS